MVRVFLCALAISCSASVANADSVCAKIKNDDARLECYDLKYKKTRNVDAKSRWSIREEVSKIDDTKNVFLSISSVDKIQKRFGGRAHAKFYIACRENTTSLWFIFAGQFLADIGSYGRVTFRVDAKKAFRRSLAESTDNQALGLWRGGSSIPFLKTLFGGDTLLVRATPYNESSITVEFPIRGIEDAIIPLRDACNW